MEFDQQTVFRILGIMGFGCYVVSYSLLSCKTLNSDSKAFFAINTLAAILVLSSNYVDFNLASAMIQVFWIAIGTLAILHRRKPNHDLSRP